MLKRIDVENNVILKWQKNELLGKLKIVKSFMRI